MFSPRLSRIASAVGIAAALFVTVAPAASANNRSHLNCPADFILESVKLRGSGGSISTEYVCLGPGDVRTTRSKLGNHTAYV